jgi:hypothetical protein
MTKDLTSARTQVTKVITDYGSTITITPVTLTTSKWGDKTEVAGTPVSTVGIPYDIFVGKFNFQPTGDVMDGDVVLIIKYNETVALDTSNVRYKVTYNSVDYNIINIENFDVANITIAKRLILSKRQ